MALRNILIWALYIMLVYYIIQAVLLANTHFRKNVTYQELKQNGNTHNEFIPFISIFYLRIFSVFHLIIDRYFVIEMWWTENIFKHKFCLLWFEKNIIWTFSWDIYLLKKQKNLRILIIFFDKDDFFACFIMTVCT